MKLYRAEIVYRERFGDHVLLRYRWTGAVPEPGQFVMVRPAGDALDPFLARPFFVHDHDGDALSILFEVRGRGTAMLAEEDGAVLVGEPRGRGFRIEGGPVALLGGGVWVAPLKLLSERLKRADIAHDVYLEIPRAAPAAYEAWISENYPGAHLVSTGDPADAPQELLARVGDLGKYAGIYVSGAPETLAAARNACAGRVPAQLAVRERMACANGSCYGCAVPVNNDGGTTYARACIDGPVFPAEALAW